MSRSQTTLLLVLTLPLLGACNNEDDPPTAPTPPTPIETIVDGRVTPNGAQTFVFTVTRQGQITAQITALSPQSDVFIGLSLGTWSPNACQILLANDGATLNTTLTGSATTVGTFCLRLYDVGTLTQPADYSVRLTHF